MSDIGRIAEQLAGHLYENGFFLESGDDAITAALLEYGAIVREECAQVVDDLVAVARPQCEANYTDGDSWLQTAAESIRKGEIV